MTNILGISAYYHDSAAALIQDGRIIAAAQEERFTRKKHDAQFPSLAVKYCLEEGGIKIEDVDEVIFYDKPFVKFERLLETYLAYAPRGFQSFLMAIPVWLKEKLFLKTTLRRKIKEIAGLTEGKLPKLMFAEHHHSHAASAFYPSPFKKAVVLCLDGVGEWATTSVWIGDGNSLKAQWEIDFPHSLGLLYSAFTYYAGFKVNSGEYKLMGLAPYGEPKYIDLIMTNLLDLKGDGTFHLDMSYFNFATGLTMTSEKFEKLFGHKRRDPESEEITQHVMDVARSIQWVTEEIVLRLCRSIHKEIGARNLCLAGGVALNCVSNGRIQREGPFDDIWIQPAAGDAGGALGAALIALYDFHDAPREINSLDSMEGAYLGPRFCNEEIERYLQSTGAKYQKLADNKLMPELAKILDNGNVVGWFQGRMEFGPRSLGGRSIIGDPRNKKMQSVMNLKIKYRESFRPFAPSVLAEDVGEYFDQQSKSPYMLIVAPLRKECRLDKAEGEEKLFGIEKLKILRSTLPAVTHVDYSARIQTVHKESNPRFHHLLSEFKNQTKCGVLVNTSFNVRGEPIVCSPEDAYRCFMRTEMDYLVMEGYLLAKKDQPEWGELESWKSEFELD